MKYEKVKKLVKELGTPVKKLMRGKKKTHRKWKDCATCEEECALRGGW